MEKEQKKAENEMKKKVNMPANKTALVDHSRAKLLT